MHNKTISRILLFPMTKWHLYGMLAFLIEQYGNAIFDRNIEVYVTSRGEQGYALSKEDMPYDNLAFNRDTNIHVTNISLFKLLFLNKSKSNSEILVLCANNLVPRKILSSLSIDELKNNKIQVIAVDDGVGSYLSDKVWEKCSEGESKSAYKDKIKVHVANSLNKKFMLKKWHMLSINDNGKLMPLHTEGYTTVIRHDIKRIFNDELNSFREKFRDKKKAIIITQPWSETNQISSNEELDIIKSVVNKIQGEYKVFIKPHPRERNGKYKFNDVDVLGREFPAEFYFYAFDSNDIVIGFDSTALVNAALLFKLNTFTLSNKMALRKDNNMMTIACEEFYDLMSGIMKEFDC